MKRQRRRRSPSSDESPLPRIGVYAICRGLALFRNLLASVRGTP